RGISIAFDVALANSGWARSADPLPSWNDGAANQSIIAFVQPTTDASGTKFVPQEARIATFDQEGTLWVEHPMYTQVMYCLDRVPARSGETQTAGAAAFQNHTVRQSRGNCEAFTTRA